jgi:hypothetical protein
MNSDEIIERLPGELQARLEADEFFADVPVVVAEEGNIKLEIERKQAVLTSKAGKRGAAVIVLQLVADDMQPNIQFGPMTLWPAFQVVENLELNRGKFGTGKSARRLARRVRDVIKGGVLWGIVADMKPDKPCIEPVKLEEELGRLVKAYQVNFQCLEQASDLPAQVALVRLVSLAPLEPRVALECATEGATIYYTTDDSYPWAGNRAAQVYTGSIEIPEAGLVVRACGYKAGMIASWVNRGELTRES